jgi:membrane protease YdiL (CAAX protease family)
MWVLGTMVLALAASLTFDWMSHRAGLTPPAFLVFEGKEAEAWRSMLRRAAAIMVLTGVLWVGVFGPLTALGDAVMPDVSELSVGALFLLHAIFAGCLLVWYLLGFAGFHGFDWRRQFGLVTRSPLREAAVGVAAGVGAWVAVIAALTAIGAVIVSLGGEDALPRETSPLIPWVAGLPIAARLAVSASAGLFEELFFRGFLQPRMGIALSTGFFVLAHANYEQPLMLVGIGLLSLIFAFLTRWRQNIWPAVVAHALFDGVQLLIVVPIVLKIIEQGEAAPWLPVARLGLGLVPGLGLGLW